MADSPTAPLSPEPSAHSASTDEADAIAPAPEDAASAPSPRAHPVVRRAGRLTAELFVVFVGVYTAFLLSRYQEDRAEDGRREAIYRALLAETDRTAAQIEDHATVLREGWIEPLVVPYEAGERPFIYGLWLPTRPLSGAWESMLAAGVDLFDPEFVRLVETHRSDVQFMLDQADRAIRLSDTHITPRMATGAFYAPDSNRLQAPFVWYPETLGYLANNAAQAAASSDSLRAELVRRLADA